MVNIEASATFNTYSNESSHDILTDEVGNFPFI